MINNDMAEYRIPRILEDPFNGNEILWFGEPIGTIEMAVYATDYSTQRNAAWKGAAFVGLTQDLTYATVTDDITGETEEYEIKKGTYLIGETPLNKNEQTRMEVMSIATRGRYYQVFLQETLAT